MKIKGENRYNNKSYRGRHDDQKIQLKSDRRISRKSTGDDSLTFSFPILHSHISKKKQLTLHFICSFCFVRSVFIRNPFGWKDL